jgi:uncharacterized protein
MNMEQQPPHPDKPVIDYPCLWTYTVIGEDPVVLRELIVTACAPATAQITHSNTSSGGKYHSLKTTVTVDSEVIRLQLYQLLKSHPAVKIVL